MRKHILFLFAVLASGILLSSCSNLEKDIVGKWKISSRNLDIKTSDQATTDRVKSMFDSRNKINENDLMEFAADKKVMNNGKEVGTYSISENKLTVSTEGISTTCEVKISGDNMTLIFDNTSDKNVKVGMGIDDSIKIEKLILTTTCTKVK